MKESYEGRNCIARGFHELSQLEEVFAIFQMLENFEWLREIRNNFPFIFPRMSSNN